MHYDSDVLQSGLQLQHFVSLFGILILLQHELEFIEPNVSVFLYFIGFIHLHDRIELLEQFIDYYKSCFFRILIISYDLGHQSIIIHRNVTNAFDLVNPNGCFGVFGSTSMVYSLILRCTCPLAQLKRIYCELSFVPAINEDDRQYLMKERSNSLARNIALSWNLIYLRIDILMILIQYYINKLCN